ncbi:hypothetical protein [Cerasicoccus fimbriatus]|uniref:hypothetical protein n=1 Tax=Cerasicoccus fimbriatus TaxID=3014554 RepID=UPI0022B3F705|nr:hypothetical protein [Cerasicoccus sp. TK19100]
MNLDQLRDRLILAIHSDKSADDYFRTHLDDPEMLLSLCVICAPYNKYSNDCRMQAAHYLSLAPSKLLGQIIPVLCVLVSIPDEGGEDMNGNIACPLLTAIERGKPFFEGIIYHDLEDLKKRYAC